FNLLCLAMVTALGYGMSRGYDLRTAHQLGGAVATIICCAVHCIVFTYFVATAKWIQHAVAIKQLDATLIAPTRSFKAHAFPAAILAMASTCFAAFVGAATFGYGLRPIYHHALALIALATNLAVAVVEYRAIARNGALIDGILQQIRQRDE